MTGNTNKALTETYNVIVEIIYLILLIAVVLIKALLPIVLLKYITAAPSLYKGGLVSSDVRFAGSQEKCVDSRVKMSEKCVAAALNYSEKCVIL